MKRHFIAEFALFGLASLTLYSFVVVGSSCIAERDKELAARSPLEAAQDQCFTKRAGSRPACWSSGDWEAYCQHVQCKEDKN